jgi:cbb3-type cytochrome oxidase subunit 3
MRHHLQNMFLLIMITFLITMLFVVLSVGKKEQIQKESDYHRVHFSPMRIHQKY